MKKTIALLLFLALASPVFADHLACSPRTDGAYYIVTGLPGVDGSHVNPVADGSLYLDLSGMPTVTTNTPRTATLQACIAGDATHTSGCSATVNFQFTQTAGPLAPTGIKIAP